MIQKDGPHRTAIATKDLLLEYAGQGISVSRSAELLGISAATLRNALKTEGLLEKYRSLFSKARESMKQGDAGTRGRCRRDVKGSLDSVCPPLA